MAEWAGGGVELFLTSLFPSAAATVYYSEQKTIFNTAVPWYVEV
jgi:hypothetical protein